MCKYYIAWLYNVNGLKWMLRLSCDIKLSSEKKNATEKSQSALDLLHTQKLCGIFSI